MVWKALKGEEPYKHWFIWANEKADLNEKRHWDESKFGIELATNIFMEYLTHHLILILKERIFGKKLKIFKYWLISVLMGLD